MQNSAGSFFTRYACRKGNESNFGRVEYTGVFSHGTHVGKAALRILRQATFIGNLDSYFKSAMFADLTLQLSTL